MTSAEGYAGRLSSYDNKGTLNLEDVPDSALAVLHKAQLLAIRLENAKHAVVHTGAGISTSAGIRDFRGPTGVWTEQSSASKRARTTPRTPTVSFEDALPTLTHVALTALHDAGYVRYVISQNVDGLHVRSGLPRNAISELHGNLFVDWCAACEREETRESEARTVGFQRSARRCPECDREMTDKALDWEDELPEPDYGRAQEQAALADLHVVAGTSCQMEPARSLPFRGTAPKHARFLVNLSRTDFDARFGALIRAECDVVFAVVAVMLEVPLPTARRVASLAFRAAAHSAARLGVEARLKWDGKWVSRAIAGVRGIRYRALGTNSADSHAYLACEPAYSAVLDASCAEVEAEVVLDGDDEDDQSGESVRVHVPIGLVLDRCTMDVTTRVIRHNVRGEALVLSLQRRVALELSDKLLAQTVNPEQLFVSGSRRGWATCALCAEEVWSRREMRERHLEECADALRLSGRWRILDS